MSPSEKILTFPRSSAPAKDRSPKWSNLDDIWLKDLAEGMKEYLEQKGSVRAVLAVADDAGGGP